VTPVPSALTLRQPEDPLVRLERATFAYGRTPVLVDLDLAFRSDEMVGIVGPSGSGKTTLLKAILGAVRPTCGTLSRAPGLRIGYVPQVETVNWSFPVTVEQVVLMARQGRRLPWASAGERRDAAAMLERLGIADLARRHIRALSGGQQQRVFLARALLDRPSLLLLDEPTSGVDVRTRHEVLHLLAELHADGLAVVLTTHDLNGMAAHLPDLICLNRTVLARGRPHDVLTPAVLERTFGAPMEVLDHMGVPLVVEALPGRRLGSA
jgi:ABC-type Mn2+/Zn2+ transport system ATPase subunit